MAYTLDTRSADAVAGHARGVFNSIFPDRGMGFIDQIFAGITDMFEGRYLDYQAIDLRYHDFQHTLQATVCFIDLIAGRHAAGLLPAITPRQSELGLAAVLLHDTGYLKLRADRSGTGAKYTFTHVLRSCAIAASYLPTLGVTLEEIDGVLGPIRCTGPTSHIAHLQFHDAQEKLICCMVATADYLGQMGATDYPDKLGLLFAEFEESDDFAGVPRERRAFRSAADLAVRTPAFWKKAILPKLHRDYLAVYTFLATPYPDGPNPYLMAVERNIERIARAGKS